MRNTLVAAALMVAAGLALSDPVARTSAGDWVRLTSEACPTEIASLAREELSEQLHMASAWIGNKPFQACWMYLPDAGAVVLLYTDGDEGVISVRDFHNEPGI